MNFKLIGSGIAALALLATPLSAEAADMPRPVYKGVRSVVAYYNWTGFYLGANAGYGFGTSNWDIGPGLETFNTSPKGAMYGFTFGYNYQVGSVVWGIEGDYDWSVVNGSSTCFVGLAVCETRNRYLATIRGRLGYAFDRFLPYITGGAAYGDVEGNVSVAGVTIGSQKVDRLGWTAGVGLEYAFLGNWTAKLEYLYVDLGTASVTFAGVLPANITFKENIVRVGLNYKFSGPVFARW
jgi:outer membrane immunogenic protein